MKNIPTQSNEIWKTFQEAQTYLTKEAYQKCKQDPSHKLTDEEKFAICFHAGIELDYINPSTFTNTEKYIINITTRQEVDVFFDGKQFQIVMKESK